MKVSVLVSRVRETLQDMDLDRYTDARIIAALNLGILDTRRIRPDYFIGRFAQPAYQIVAATEEFDLPETLIPSLIRFAVGWVELADDEYATDGRAAAMLKMFEGDLRT